MGRPTRCNCGCTKTAAFNEVWTMTGSNGIASACCPSNNLPNTLHLTIVVTGCGFGGTTPPNGTFVFVLTWANFTNWNGTITGLGQLNGTVTFQCSGGAWLLSCPGSCMDATRASTTCAPLSVVYNQAINVVSCGCIISSSIQYTVSL